MDYLFIYLFIFIKNFDERKTLFVGLEHTVLICVYMELQRRDGSQSEFEILIGKYVVWVFIESDGGVGSEFGRHMA